MAVADMKASNTAVLWILTCFNVPLKFSIPFSKVQAESCSLGGNLYQVGDTWHPKLLPFGENACINCTCLQGGEVKCSGLNCPKPGCEEPRIIAGQCCPVCTDGNSVASSVAKTEPTESQRQSIPGCDFDGMHYDDGDIFPSNKTALKPKHTNQCVLCACYRGDVICHLKSCLSMQKCNKTMKVDDDCCLQCDDISDWRVFTKVVSQEFNSTSPSGECMSASGNWKNGTTWKPVIGQFGEMKCIKCACINGHINCSRMQCPGRSSVLCNTSDLLLNECCKQCSNESKQITAKGHVKKRCKSNGMERDINKQCRSIGTFTNKKKTPNNNQKNNVTIYGEKVPLYEVLPQLCKLEKSQHFVYKKKINSEESLLFDWFNASEMQHIHWINTKGKFHSIEHRVISTPDEYRKMLTVSDFLGVVQTKEMKKFFKRLSVIQQKCKKKCKRRMLDKSIKKLNLKKLDLSLPCNMS